jgi:hypothetical protein
MIRSTLAPAVGVATMALACSSSGLGPARTDAGPSGDLANAALDYPTFQALQTKVLMQTCAPVSGLCHNSKEYPDMHTPENTLATINERCNALVSDVARIQDMCEREGDLLVIKSGPDEDWQTRIGFVIDQTSQSPPTIVLTLHDPVPHDAVRVLASIVRDVDPENPQEIPLGAALSTAAGDGKATLALADLSAGLDAFFTSPYTPGLSAQLIAGDPNRNGIFGADLGGALIKPGALDKSFLIQRILGAVPPQMPLGSGDLSPEQIDAIECWTYQLAPDGSNADGPIDYARCPPGLPQPAAQPPGP